ncbi:hypothetical protein AB3466_07075 [Sphingobacterium thalpophilum]|uniref:hypothetical protein n=1 Tax=Sphingobacterium thalpophilum TaxID=259 RepID=UPI0037D9E51C
MEIKNTQKSNQGRSPYEVPKISIEQVALEYSVAAGSVQTEGGIQQQWDGEESTTTSQSEGWW